MKLIKFSYVLLKLMILLLVLGCATVKPKEPLVALNSEGREFEFKLKPTLNRKELSQHFSNSYVKSFSEDQISRERQESVEFDVASEVLKYDAEKGFIHSLISTVRKDGAADLHDMAFPELDERIETVYTEDAEVIYVSGFPESTVFYVPPLSLPKRKVKVGDTWDMQSSWVSMKNAIPLNINMITILKNVYSCDGDDLCADFEISGEVGIIASLNPNTSYKSDLRGRIIFSVNRGTVLWSLLQSDEVMAVDQEKVSVKSCMVSFLKEPKSEKWPFLKDEQCDPKEPIVVPVNL